MKSAMKQFGDIAARISDQPRETLAKQIKGSTTGDDKP
jgi:hypothetical protein